jgi:cyclopropane-fatty-acyl-phospholipid synthase
MTYSSALFEHDARGHGAASENDPAQQHRVLAEAQRSKYRRILDVLNVREGEHILEIGCGWGGFAEEAGRRGAHVHGLTLSPAQLDYARARMSREGLQDRVTLEIRDYRDSRGQFDHVVSIEMFEAVGERYWQTYFDTIAARLKARGRAVVQAISIAESAFPSYRRGSDFIREYIFPGGMLAPLARMQQDALRAGLVTHDVHSFGLDYAHTLAIWQQRVVREAQAVQPLGFDERFLRLWRFYLSYCEAGFRCRRTDVHQLLLGLR